MLGVASCLLMGLEAGTSWMDPLRSRLASPLRPIYWTAEAPHRLIALASESVATRRELEARNKELSAENTRLAAAVQQAAALAEENRRLRTLLGSREKVADRVLVAELLGTGGNPQHREILLDKGSRDGVFVGQAVLDAHGLVGQVSLAAAGFCRVLLLTDPDHAIPVQVNRTGLRGVAAGLGTDLLELLYVPVSADIREGDLLISSGLGDVFPPGYPVAVVSAVVRDANAAFASIQARPLAQLERSREFLLVFRSDAQPSGELAAVD